MEIYTLRNEHLQFVKQNVCNLRNECIIIITGHCITFIQLTLNTERSQTQFCFELIHHHSFLRFKHAMFRLAYNGKPIEP